MSEYIMQTLRLDSVFNTREAAIAWLDAYTEHRVGQPISLLYHSMDENQEIRDRVLFAVGAQDSDGTESGPEYYTIINEEASEITWNEINIE